MKLKKLLILVMFFSWMFMGADASAQALAVKQGEVFFYPVNYEKNISATFGGEKVPVFQHDGKTHILIATDVRKKPGNYNLRIKSGTKELEKKVIQVTKGDYIEVVRGVPYKFAALPKDTQARVTKDKSELTVLLNAAVREPSPKVWESFTNPLDQMTVTSPYGYTRLYTNHSTIHHGADLRAEVGTPVYAVAEGKVLWGEGKALYQEGPMVAIDHGDGIISKYLHLSEVLVKAGAMVKTGELIGYSGDEGADVSGAHLHFAIKVGNASVNPLQFIIEAQKLDSKAQKTEIEETSPATKTRNTALKRNVNFISFIVPFFQPYMPGIAFVPVF